LLLVSLADHEFIAIKHDGFLRDKLIGSHLIPLIWFYLFLFVFHFTSPYFMFNVFIGIILGCIAYYVSVDLAIGLGLLLLILNPRIVVKRVVPKVDQKALKEELDKQPIEQYSDNIIGKYMDNPIHEFIVVKNQATGICRRFDYFDIIPCNNSGDFIAAPSPGQVFLSTGLIYQDSGVVVQPQ